jgi:hypothetical protein
MTVEPAEPAIVAARFRTAAWVSASAVVTATIVAWRGPGLSMGRSFRVVGERRRDGVAAGVAIARQTRHPSRACG